MMSDDVDQRPDGDIATSGRSPRTSASPTCWCSAWRRCRCRSRCRASPTASPGRSSAGCPTTSAARARWRSRSRSRRSRSCVLFAFIDHPALFVVLTGLVFFGWGEIFSLFPVDADRYVRAEATRRPITASSTSRRASARSSAARRRPSSSSRPEAGPRCSSSSRCLDALTAVLALTVLKQMRRRHFEATNCSSETAELTRQPARSRAVLAATGPAAADDGRHHGRRPRRRPRASCQSARSARRDRPSP